MPEVLTLLFDQSFISDTGLANTLTANSFRFCPVNNNKPLPPSPIASTTSYWQCANGSCLPSSAVTPYTTECACASAVIYPPFAGGQCAVTYLVTYNMYKTNMSGVESDFPSAGSNPQTAVVPYGGISGMTIVYGNLTATNGYESYMAYFKTAGGLYLAGGASGGGGLGVTSARANIISLVRQDGQPDNCGNLPSTCPV